jgi:transposase
MASRRRHSKEFKVEAIRLVRERGVSIAQAARDLDIHVNVLRTWIRQFERDQANAFPGVGRQTGEAAEITQLKREVARLKMERDILKKAAAYFAKESM